VFTPQIQVSSIDNRIVNISICEDGAWITNNIRTIHHRLDSSYDGLTVSPEKIAIELQEKTTEKKIFLIGEYIDIDSLFLIEYIVEHNENCLIVMDDSQIERNLVDKMGLNKDDIAYVDCAVFVGINQTSSRYYIKRQIKKLQTCINVSDIESIPDLTSHSNPYIFMGASIFPLSVSPLQKLKTPFAIIPKNISQMAMKYMKNYMPLSEFETKYNRHDIKFICSVGERPYSPPYEADVFHIKGRHFLEDSCKYMNVFGEIIHTSTKIQSSSESTRAFLVKVLQVLYEENYEEVLYMIRSQYKSFLKNMR
jgi:hypothetical protein